MCSGAWWAVGVCCNCKEPLMAVRKQRLPEPEELFLDYVKRMARHRDGREVLLVHMSALEFGNRTRHRIELVTARLGQAARKFDGRVFRFANGDIACILRQASPGLVDNLLFEIRYGFSEDALVQAEDAGEGVFIERFDVRWDYESVEKLAKDRLASLKDVTSASVTATEPAAEPVVAARNHRDPSPQHGNTADGVGERADEKGAQKKTASLVEMDRSKHKAKPASGPEAQVATGPLDQWIAENSVCAGETAMPLNEVLRTLPICEIGRPGQPAVGATLQVNRRDLIDAYARASGMKMAERLEDYLLEETEMSLVQLLGSLVSPNPNLRQSVCLSPRVILSPDFLLAARAWRKAGKNGTLFWFDPDDIDQETPPMPYIADFLHDMGHLVGIRGLVPGDLGKCSARLPQVDGWALKWPELDLNRTPRGEIDSLTRALGDWGAEHCFVQGINSESKAVAAKDFGFRYTECVDVAAVKLFSRPF